MRAVYHIPIAEFRDDMDEEQLEAYVGNVPAVLDYLGHSMVAKSVAKVFRT